MKNYRNSDYALNKYSKGIVYRFADRIVEVTLEDYLQENPDKTEKDFLELKVLSDEMYLEQVRIETAQGNKLVSFHGLEETEACATHSLDEEYIEDEDKRRAVLAVDKLFCEGRMTEKQKRRFISHFYEGKSFRAIAKEEGVFFTSVAECIAAATKKLKRYFEKL